MRLLALTIEPPRARVPVLKSFMFGLSDALLVDAYMVIRIPDDLDVSDAIQKATCVADLEEKLLALGCEVMRNS